MDTPTWMQVSIHKYDGNLDRRLTVDSHLCRGPRIVITTDACPTGIGVVLEIDGMITYYFWTALQRWTEQI